MAHLRSDVIRTVVYLEDILIMAVTISEVIDAIKTVRLLLESFGFCH